jgi:hypothetical protein
MPLLAGHTKLSELSCDEFKQLVNEIVSDALARAPVDDASAAFIGSKACAALLDITPEHLCAMRGRGEGPPWSGGGKWVRYRRDQVIAWLTQLPQKAVAARTTNTPSDGAMLAQARPP